MAERTEWEAGVDDALESNADRLLMVSDVLLGTEIDDFLGGGREEDGVVHDVKEIKEMLANGAAKPTIELTRKQKIVMWAGGLIITLVVPFLAASLAS